MKIIRKYTAIQILTKKVNQNIEVDLSFGEIEGPYYDQTYPEQEFDTEEEAIKYAYKKDKWSEWLIIPKIKFDRFDEDFNK